MCPKGCQVWYFRHDSSVKASLPSGGSVCVRAHVLMWLKKRDVWHTNQTKDLIWDEEITWFMYLFVYLFSCCLTPDLVVFFYLQKMSSGDEGTPTLSKFSDCVLVLSNGPFFYCYMRPSLKHSDEIQNMKYFIPRSKIVTFVFFFCIFKNILLVSRVKTVKKCANQQVLTEKRPVCLDIGVSTVILSISLIPFHLWWLFCSLVTSTWW